MAPVSPLQDQHYSSAPENLLLTASLQRKDSVAVGVTFLDLITSEFYTAKEPWLKAPGEIQPNWVTGTAHDSCALHSPSPIPMAVQPAPFLPFSMGPAATPVVHTFPVSMLDSSRKQLEESEEVVTVRASTEDAVRASTSHGCLWQAPLSPAHQSLL